MNCSKLIGDRSRFYLHCLTPSSSRFGVTSGACSVACFSTNSEAPQAPLFYYETRNETHQPRACAREGSFSGEMRYYAHNLHYDNYGVDMLYPKHCKNRYADQVQDAVVLQPKKLANWLKIPPRGLQQDGGVLVLVHTQSAPNFAPHPMFVLS